MLSEMLDHQSPIFNIVTLRVKLIFFMQSYSVTKLFNLCRELICIILFPFHNNDKSLENLEKINSFYAFLLLIKNIFFFAPFKDFTCSLL